MDSQGFLRSVGTRLRDTREASGRSLSAVAREAGVSRRYLTDAEAGRANPTVLILARLAIALGAKGGAPVSIASFVDIPLRQRPSGRVALVGLRGAGKSTVGRALALSLEAPFVELDERIEKVAGLSLAEIFDLHGTAAYRRFEAEALEQVLSEGDRLVLATGGSIVTSGANYKRLLETCRGVWLSAEPEIHYSRVLAQGDSRPMENHPRAMEELAGLLQERAALHRRTELKIDTSTLTVTEVQNLVLAFLDKE
ncbi:MAG: XRE family aerobic/anaerobic benzoate catabolism transcriptional regulator [Planctomycetota bacterium]|jgi:XRE family aerobic/anaerobic benzoate catabolism transcriptional regulator